jgi:hypothetical protein
MNQHEREIIAAAAKYFEILHLSLSDLDARIRILERKTDPAAIHSSYPASLSLQLSAVQQMLEKLLR